jgi:hypothetical protein
MVRKAFDLLVEIRAHPKAYRTLSLAIGFLETLVREPDEEAQPVVVAIQAVRIRNV